MSFFTTQDGVDIFTRLEAVSRSCFIIIWPLSSDDWDAQILFFLQLGYRVVATDRVVLAGRRRFQKETIWTITLRTRQRWLTTWICGMPSTHPDILNAKMLRFIRS